MPKQPKTQVQKTSIDYENLGKMLENIYQTGYVDRNQMYKMSFFKGVVAGFGGVLGATILVALLVWILSLFETVPLVGPVFDNLEDTVNSRSD